MSWTGLATGLLFALAFVAGFWTCFKLKVWHSVAYERQQREYEAREDHQSEMDAILARMKATGPMNPQVEDSSPFGPVPPTPDELDRQKVVKEWQKLSRSR